MTNQPFFTTDRDAYIPTDATRGPWDPNSLHGRVIVGLLAFEIERRHGAEDFVPARLTVDMFRLPNLSPIEVKTRLVRDGLRIKLIEADFFSAGVAMARASCQLLRKTQNPQGTVWSPPNWEVPKPADIPAPIDPRLGMHGKWATRPIAGAMGTVGPRRLWMSEVRDLVEGEALTPFVRVALAADFAQPLCQCRRSGPRLHQQRRHAVPASPAGAAMDRVRGGEPSRHRRHRDRRVFSLRPAGRDRDLNCRSPGAAQADAEAGAGVNVIPGHAASRGPGISRFQVRAAARPGMTDTQ
jgi:hypothetical protein